MKSTKILAIGITGLLTLLVSSTGYGIPPNENVQDQVSSMGADRTTNTTIPYTGNLTDGEGNPVTDGVYAFKFFLFEDQSNNETLWSEEQQEVEVESGVFNVQLGSVHPLPAKALQSDQLFLQIAVRASGDDSYTTLDPPQVLQPVSASNPESVSAQAACAHDHFSEMWEGDNYYLGLYVENDRPDSTGILGSGKHVGLSGNGVDIGVKGVSLNSFGYTLSTPVGVMGVSEYSDTDGIGVWGKGESHGVYGLTKGDWSYRSGVYGEASMAHANGVTGENTGDGVGVYGKSETGYAGYFAGDVHITGDLTQLSAGTKIDHPLDPENQYLNHSFVESPDMKNVYDGVVVLDANGKAWVELPAYFETLNKDFRYQLTAIGAPAPGLYIGQEIEENRFQIAGGTPDLKVSWQVTGIRHDPYAEAHPILVEEEKVEEEKGKYLHPVELGHPEILGLDTHRNQEPAN